jgi:maleylpyruvate isomerase
MGQVPVLLVDGPGAPRRISQSVAIAEYLDERFPDPPLLGRVPEERAHVRQLVEIVNSGIQPLQNMKTIGEVRRLGGDAAVAAWLDRFIHRGLAALEWHASAASGPFVAGPAVTLADVFLVPQLEFARRFADLAPGRYPALEAAEAACLELEEFASPPLPPAHSA